MKLEIKITKDILKRSMMCGSNNYRGNISESCAIALAIIDIFKNARVGRENIRIINTHKVECISLPISATNFIDEFDSLRNHPKERLNLPEFSFEIDVPEEVINSIGIDQAIEIINNSSTLELVN